MPKRKVRFMGILTNVDSSVLGVKFDHGFTVESLTGKELIELFIKLNKNSYDSARSKVVENAYLNFEEEKAYLISNTIDNIQISTEGILDNKNFIAVQAWGNKYYGNYLYEKLRLMRLYKEGHLFMPERFFFFEKETSLLFRNQSVYSTSFLGKSIYSLKASELSEINLYIQNMKFPFKGLPLKLAHNNYDLSYTINQRHLSFLSLMISLESLFSPSGEGELRYRISRNTAVLIGKNKIESEKIWDDIRMLYDKRCDLVHNGKADNVTNEDVLILRDYVRRSIIEFDKCKKSKDEIIKKLNLSGFGERPFQ